MTHKQGRLGGVSRRKFLASVGSMGALTIAGCTSEGSQDGDDGGGNDGDELSGNVRISGSSTVYPIATAVGELFEEDHPEVTIDLSRDGSSGGFENVFVPGDADINNASRAITDEEVQNCRDNGFEPVEFMVAQDALTVVVNDENDWVDAMTYDDLNAIWTDEDPPETWSDVDGDWPDEPFDLYGPASTSGTFDYFTETINGEAGKIRDDFEGTEEDDQIATGVDGNPYALGYLPFAYYMNNPDETKALAIAEDDIDEAADPGLDAASTGEYPLARPLFFYGNMNKIQEKEHLREYIRFYIDQTTDEQLIAEQIGYVQSSEEQAGENRDALEAAIDGDYEFER